MTLTWGGIECEEDGIGIEEVQNIVNERISKFFENYTATTSTTEKPEQQETHGIRMEDVKNLLDEMGPKILASITSTTTEKTKEQEKEATWLEKYWYVLVVVAVALIAIFIFLYKIHEGVKKTNNATCGVVKTGKKTQEKKTQKITK